MLFVNAHNVLNRLSFEVLLSTGFEKFIIATEVVENVFVAVASTLKKWVLSQVVFLLESLVLVVCEDLKHLHILVLHGKEDRSVSFKVRLKTLFRSHFEKFADE